MKEINEIINYLESMINGLEEEHEFTNVASFDLDYMLPTLSKQLANAEKVKEQINQPIKLEFLGETLPYIQPKIHNKPYLYAETELIHNCNHDKEYDTTTMLCSDPPQYRWKCKKCNEVGYDYWWDVPISQRDVDEYWIRRKENK